MLERSHWIGRRIKRLSCCPNQANTNLKGASPQYLSAFVLPKDTTSKMTGVEDSFFDALYGQFKAVSAKGQYVPAFRHPKATVKSGLFHIQSSSDIGVGITTLSVISSKSRKDLADLGTTIKGIPFDGLPSHPIFQTELSGQTDIPNQTIRSLLFVGVVRVHTITRMRRWTMAVATCSRTRFNLRRPMISLPRLKRKVFFLKYAFYCAK